MRYARPASSPIYAANHGCPAADPCDPELKSKADPQDKSGYTERAKGERCEGTYLQQVSATYGGLWIASLTASRAVLARWAGPLPLEWPSLGNGSVRIQAFPLRPRTYYRSDVTPPAGSTSYLCNTDLVANRLPPAEVGLVAWTETAINGRGQRVYLPVSTQKPASASAKPYKLIVIPPVELREVYLTVAENANRAKPLLDHTALKCGSYSANQKIEIDLPPLAKPGLCLVEVSGDRRDHSRVTTGPFLIQHAP